MHSLFLKTNKCKLCTKFNLVTDLQIMLSNVPDSRLNPEYNTESGFIDQLFIELGNEWAGLAQFIVYRMKNSRQGRKLFTSE